MISYHTLSLNHCQLSSHLPHYLRLGILEQTNGLPALWPIAWNKPFLLQYSAVDSQVAYDIIEYWSLQIMLQAPVSKLQTVLFDSGLQQAFATLEQIRLQTEYQAVITIPDVKGQAEYLRELATKARSRKSLLSQSGCQNWQQYQETVKSAEPCLLCIISDVSQLLQDDELSNVLMDLLTHAARLGIFLWLLMPYIPQTNDYQSEQRERKIQQIQNAAWRVELKDNRLKIVSSESLTTDWNVINWFGVQAEFPDEKSKKHALAVITARFSQQESPAGSDFIKIRIGLHEGKPFYFRMGEGSDVYHGLMAGAAGTGKTSFLNQLICQICETHTPEQVQLFLFDYKEGVSFGLFEGLAHVPVLLLDNDKPEMMLYYLDVFKKEIARRGKLFKDKSPTIDKISKYNAVAEQALPRWLMIVDEVQSLFESPTFAMKNEVSNAIKEVARKGRSFGLHLLFSTQSYRGVDIDEAAKGQMRLRISFRLNNAIECYSLFNKDNEAALKLPRFCAIYNAEDGEPSANRVVQMDYLDTSDINARMDILRENYPLSSKSQVTLQLPPEPPATKTNISDSPLEMFKGLM